MHKFDFLPKSRIVSFYLTKFRQKVFAGFAHVSRQKGIQHIYTLFTIVVYCKYTECVFTWYMHYIVYTYFDCSRRRQDDKVANFDAPSQQYPMQPTQINLYSSLVMIFFFFFSIEQRNCPC